MTPKSFDITTAKEIVGDARMRQIESKARQDADNGVFDLPKSASSSYWDGVVSQMDDVVYRTAYTKRTDRIQRMRLADADGSTSRGSANSSVLNQ